MKTLTLITFAVALTVVPMARAQKGTLVFPKDSDASPDSVPAPPPSSPPVYQNPAPRNMVTPQATPSQVYVYDQKPLGGRPELVTSDQAQGIINRFKAAYPKLGSPRLLIYVNRELVNRDSGMKLVRRSERTESFRSSSTNAGSTVKSTADNTYATDGKAPPTLADKQTVRDVERLFGRPLRSAGASLADQRVASQLIADRPLDEFIGTSDTPEARKDREALNNIADVVIEVLISSKTMNVPSISGSQTLTVPDIQATAISLKDSKILGQASSNDVMNRVPPSSLGYFDVREISEATALELMEDMAPPQ